MVASLLKIIIARLPVYFIVLMLISYNHFYVLIALTIHVLLNHGTIIRTGITCKKIPLEKSIEFDMALKWSATRYKQETEIFVVTRPPTC